MEQKNFTVENSDKKTRLDKYLAVKLPKFSRSFLQNLIRKKEVIVNGMVFGAADKVKNGDKISITLNEPLKISLKPESDIKLNIILENENYLIINKPSGIVVHPSQSTPIHTLVNSLIAYYPKIVTVGDDPKRPGIVHRLDKDVSGIMVIAKNQKTFEHLKTLFKNRKVQKKYTALVYGKIVPLNGKISAPIGRSKSKPNRMSVKRVGDGKEAITFYKTIKQYQSYSLLEIETKTGRTHQIRVHLLSKGNPIVGDAIYYLKKAKNNREIDRIFLHAHSIQFTDMNDNLLKFRADIPKKLKQFLTQLTK
ncbi:MAG: RluA family pseudouridine synthase [Patescibacteria group bacterium]